MTPADRAAAVLAGTPLIDGHNDLAWEARTQVGYDWAALGFATGNGGRTQTDLPRLRTGRVGAQFWSVYVPCRLRGAEAVKATLEQIDGVRRLVAEHPRDLVLCTTADEVEAAHAAGRIGSLMGAEGGHSIDNSLGVLRLLRDLGVGYLTLTHNENTDWADSATDVLQHGGLTDFGREVVAEMNRIGMLVDLSHVSQDTMRDALAVTKAPPIFSHSNCGAICDSPRNVPDDVLTTLRTAGGVLMLSLVPDFLAQECADWRAAAREAAVAQGIDPRDLTAFDAFADGEFSARVTRPEATIADVVAHFEHAREVCGVESLGIGGDFDGIDRGPIGLEDVSRYPVLFAALAEAGWSDDDLAAVAGRNVLRVMRASEATAEVEGG